LTVDRRTSFSKTGWLTHLWKSLTRQDHAHWRATIAQFLPPDGTAIDVGAHGGQFTRLLAGVAPVGLVVAVEPSSYARSILRLMLWVRGIKNAIVVATALGEKPGLAVMRTPIKRHNEMGYGLGSLANVSRLSVSNFVPVVTLDQLVEVLGLTALHFVKADIEGFEASFIAGGMLAIKLHQPVILIEMSDPALARAGSSLASLWARLVSLGYMAYVQREVGQLVACAEVPREGDIFWIPAGVSL
jgi:FkbM family methyltransferase